MTDNSIKQLKRLMKDKSLHEDDVNAICDAIAALEDRKRYERAIEKILSLIEETRKKKTEQFSTKPKNIANIEIRQAIVKKGLRYYEVAEACGVSLYTFSHWLQTEMKPEKKSEIIKNIERNFYE